MDGIDLFLDEVATARHRELQFTPKAERLDLTWGHPDPTLLPVDELRTAADAVLSDRGWRALSYGTSEGSGRLRHALAERLGRGTTSEEVVITHGSSGALDLVLGVLSEPGDVVLVEQPTYFLALRIMADRGLRIVGLPPGTDGAFTFDHQVRRVRAEGHRGRVFLYVCPTHANPTGHSMSGQEKRFIASAAADHEVIVIEDEVYVEIGPYARSPRPLWALDPERIVRLGSFSKTIAPGLRLGYVRTTAERAAALAGCGLLDSGGGINPLVAGIVAEIIETGAYDRVLGRLRIAYGERMATLVGALGPMSSELALHPPDGGFFAWLSGPPGCEDLVAEAAAVGVALSPAAPFFVDPVGGRSARASISLLGPADLAEAAARLRPILGSGASPDQP